MSLLLLQVIVIIFAILFFLFIYAYIMFVHNNRIILTIQIIGIIMIYWGGLIVLYYIGKKYDINDIQLIWFTLII